MKRAVNIMLLRIAVLACCVFISGLSFGSQVSEQTAGQIAVNFFKMQLKGSSRVPLTAQLQYQRTEAGGGADFYVFNMQPIKGFVIVAGSDNVVPVLAYSLEGPFVFDASADAGINCWLNKATQCVHQAILNDLPPDNRIKNLWSGYLQGNDPVDAKGTSVEPLLTTTWDQCRRVNTDIELDAPFYYNLLCPSDGALKCVAGCNAIALAQILKYWNYPPQGTGSYIDVLSTFGFLPADFGSTVYNWSIMPNVINSDNYQSSGAIAVDTLIYQCGIAVDMDYTTTSSNSDLWGGASAYAAYTNYFSYDPNTITVEQSDEVSQSDWISLIQTELNAGRVVQYRGYDSVSAEGHIWDCDGYENVDFLHMNWGWGGMDNGFYQLGALNPGGEIFNSGDDMLIGIQPISTGVVSHQAAFNNMQISPNPASNWLLVKVNCATPVGACTLNIYNALGQVAGTYDTNLNPGQNKINLSVNSLAAGVYFVSVGNSNELITGKFIRTE